MVADLDKAKISVKVLDFGLAKLTDDRAKQSLTAVGEVFGSPFYMSPEQCDGQRVDARSDIYSLGCGLFEVLTGRPPFNGHLVQAVIFSHQEAEPPTLSSLLGVGVVPENLEVAVSKILKKQPAERYQSMAELREDLLKIKSGVGSGRSLLPEAPEKSNQKNLKNRTPASVLLPVLIFSIALLGVVFVIKQMPSAGPSKNLDTNTDVPLSAVSQNEKTIEDAFATALPSTRQKSSTQPFSTVGENFDTHGRPLRRFVFPPGVDLGYLALNGGDSARVKATGVVDFPADAKITFYPAGTFLQNSRYFPRFQKGDIDCLNLTNVMVPELQASTKIVGVRALIVESSAYIDDGCIGQMGKFEDLESLQISDADLTGEGIGKLPTLLRLKHLSVTACELVDGLCRALERSRALKYLKLGNAGLSDASFHSLAKIVSLEQLHLKGEVLSQNNLAELSKLPHLSELEIPSTRITEAEIPILQKFSALKKLRVAPMSKHELSLFTEKLQGISLEASR